MALHITDKFGLNEYLKCLFCILKKYGSKTGIGLDKGHLQELPASWKSELQIVDLGPKVEVRRNPQPNQPIIIHRIPSSIAEFGTQELLVVLWLLLKANKNYLRIRKRVFDKIPDDWMNMLEIKENPHNFLLTLRQEKARSIIIDPTAIEMPGKRE